MRNESNARAAGCTTTFAHFLKCHLVRCAFACHALEMGFGKHYNILQLDKIEG
jgi:hypothetical protein